MTELSRVVRRKVRTVRGEPLVVILTPEGIWIREPRQRGGYLLPFGLAYQWAGELAAEAKRATKKRRVR